MLICSEQEMKSFGGNLIQCSESPGIVTLNGDLGTGKTTIVRGALEACGITTGVRSPTYTLVEYYELQNFSIAHFDLYRLSDPEELEYLGYRDYLRPDTWCFIEWPERAAGYLENIGLQISIAYQHECRNIEASADNAWGERLRSALNLT